MPLAPNCQIMSWQKSQFASQLVVQKRIDKICEVEGRPMQRNRPDSRILIIFACGVRNPGLWNPGNSAKKSGIPLTIGLKATTTKQTKWKPFYLQVYRAGVNERLDITSYFGTALADFGICNQFPAVMRCIFL